MARILGWIARGIMFISPWIARLAGATFWAVSTAAAVWWVGVPDTAQRIADYWRLKAYEAGIPTEYEQAMYYIGYAVALAVILGTWIAAAFVTVALLTIIF